MLPGFPTMLMATGRDIVFVGSQQSPTTTTINKPSGVIEGDLMVAALANSSTFARSTLSGWTLGVDSLGINIQYKVAGNSEPSNYAFPTLSAGNGGIIAAYRFAEWGVIGTVASSATASSITLTKDKSVLLGFFKSAGATTITAPTGMSSVGSVVSGGPSFGLFGQPNMPLGATGTRAAGGAPDTSVLFGVRPIS